MSMLGKTGLQATDEHVRHSGRLRDAMWRLSGYRLGELPVLTAPRQFGKRTRMQDLKRTLQGVPAGARRHHWWNSFDYPSPPKITLVAHLVGYRPPPTVPAFIKHYSFRKETL